MKPNSKLRKQRPSKCPLHLKDKLEKLLGQLQDSGIIREMGDDDEQGSLFVNPIILLPKADYVKLVIDARYLKSITNLTNYWWLLEPIQMIMTRISGKYFTAIDFSCAYQQVPLSPETDRLCNRRKAIHLSSWILWTLWSTSTVQPDDGDQLGTPH